MKTWYLEDWNHFNLEVTGRYVKGKPARINDIPERCYEGEASTIERMRVYCNAKEITDSVTQKGFELIMEDVISMEESL